MSRPDVRDYVQVRVERGRGRRRRRRDIALLAAALAAFTVAPLANQALGAATRPAGAAPVLKAAAAQRLRVASPAPSPPGPAPSGVPPTLTYSWSWVGSHGSPDLGLKAESAVLVDLDSRSVVWSKDARKRLPPASLAKMVTAMVAVDQASLDQELTVPQEAAQVEPNVMGLTAGEVVSVRILLYGLFLDSGNDAAETLSRAIIPRERFLVEMNAKVKRFGLTDSHFSNPSGLDDPGLYSSAENLAVVAGHLVLEYPQLVEIAGTREKPIPGTPAHKVFDPWNLNKMLWTYPGAIGLKTGFTEQAGGCVAAAANRNGRRLLALVLHSDLFFTDAGKLLDYGFAVHPSADLADVGRFPHL